MAKIDDSGDKPKFLYLEASNGYYHHTEPPIDDAEKAFLKELLQKVADRKNTFAMWPNSFSYDQRDYETDDHLCDLLTGILEKV